MHVPPFSPLFVLSGQVVVVPHVALVRMAPLNDDPDRFAPSSVAAVKLRR